MKILILIFTLIWENDYRISYKLYKKNCENLYFKNLHVTNKQIMQIHIN